MRLGFDGGVTTEKYYGTSPEHTKVFWQDPPPGTLRRAHDDVRMWACPTTEHCVSPPQDFIDFQRRIAITNVSDPQPPAVARFLLGTHPSTLERIGQAKAFER